LARCGFVGSGLDLTYDIIRRMTEVSYKKTLGYSIMIYLATIHRS